jgi:hypothetical protein
MVGVVEYRRVDEEGEGAGGGGAPAVLRKMRAQAWLMALTVAGTGMC